MILGNPNYFINFRIPLDGIYSSDSIQSSLWIWAAVRGYHYYRRFWIPQKDQILGWFFETPNPFDCLAIKVFEVKNENSVDHLPREISGVTKFFKDRGAIITAQLTSKHYHRPAVVQDGMEIACKVTVKIPGTWVDILLMEKYKQLVEQLYIEPKNGEILGSFLQSIETIDGVEAQPLLK